MDLDLGHGRNDCKCVSEATQPIVHYVILDKYLQIFKTSTMIFEDFCKYLNTQAHMYLSTTDIFIVLVITVLVCIKLN